MLIIMEAFEDPELDDSDKIQVMIDTVYIDPVYTEDAAKKAAWFVDGGELPSKSTTHRVISWVQDEQIIFPAINKVAGCEVRLQPYIHWWTFLGYFMNIGEGLLSTIVSVRDKMARNKPLEKWEKDFVLQNYDKVKIKPRFTAEELEYIERMKQ